MTAPPAPRRLVLASASRAGDAGYLAAADLGTVAADLDVDYRLVGGNAVTLLTALYAVDDRVPARETADADFGAGYDVIGDARLPEALSSLGYRRTAGNRFERTDTASPDPIGLCVDVLAPSHQSRMLSNQPHGDLVVDEIPGLGLALVRPPVDVHVEVRLSDGRALATTLRLPDPVAALCLKAFAYDGRLAARDAIDVWRLLETASAAGIRAADWPDGPTPRGAARLLHLWFGRVGSAGPRDATSSRSQQARIRALVAQAVPPP